MRVQNKIQSKRGFDIVCLEDRTLVVTEMQEFLLLAPQNPRYLQAIRDKAQYIRSMNQLVGMFYNDWNEQVVTMVSVNRNWYL